MIINFLIKYFLFELLIVSGVLEDYVLIMVYWRFMEVGVNGLNLLSVFYYVMEVCVIDIEVVLIYSK